MSKKGLGRGLGALIPEVDLVEKGKPGVVELEIGLIDPNANQPRKSFDQEKLEELAASIRVHGVVQPIVVRSKGSRYEIVAGERRWRAAQLAGLAKIPAVVREFSEAEVMEIALIENLQRQDLNPLEEAQAYRLLIEEFKLTQEELARRLGKSRPQISNTLRLLQLGPVARAEVEAGRLSMGHAKVLLGVADPVEQDMVAATAAAEGLSVRELEELIRRRRRSVARTRRESGSKAVDLALIDVERRLNEFFGTPVKVVMGEKSGRVEITFFGSEGLERILEVLGIEERKGIRPPRGSFHV